MLLSSYRRILLGRRLYYNSGFHTSSVWYASRKVLQKFKLADIGEGITECEVIKWNVKPTGSVTMFDPLCEVQSDKASVEITSPFDGVVKQILVDEGEVAKVGADLCIIEVDEETLEGVDPAQVEPVSSPPPHQEQEATQSEADSFANTQSSATPPLPSVSESRQPHPLDPNKPSTKSQDNVLALPAVRHLARQSGVDLTLLAPGSGKNGRIEKVDVERYLAAGKQTPKTNTAAFEEDVVVELGRTRYGMWKAMTKSLEIPHFGYSTYLDLTALHHLLPTLNAHIPTHFLPSPPTAPIMVSPTSVYTPPSSPPVPDSATYTKLTYLPILLKTLSKAMLEWPLFRSSITPSSDPSAKPTLTIRPNSDISIALSTPTGLYTPTLQRANTHSIYSLASSLKHISHLGRQTPSAITPNEMPKRGGTVTVSNVGAIGAGEFAMPVLVPGTGVAIVAVGRAKWVWDVERGDGKGERRLKVGVSWSADHRVVEGAELAAFVECWRSYVEQPERLIGEGI